MLRKIDFAWPSHLQNTLQAFDLFNVDIYSFFPPECAGFDFAHRIYFVLVGPLGVAGVVVVLGLLSYMYIKVIQTSCGRVLCDILWPGLKHRFYPGESYRNSVHLLATAGRSSRVAPISSSNFETSDKISNRESAITLGNRRASLAPGNTGNEKGAKTAITSTQSSQYEWFENNNDHESLFQRLWNRVGVCVIIAPLEQPLHKRMTATVVSSLVLMLVWVYTRLADAAFAIFACKFESSSRPSALLRADPSNECPPRSTLLVCAILATVFYVLGIPAMVCALLFKHREVIKHKKYLDKVFEGTPPPLVVEQRERLEEAKSNFGFLFWKIKPEKAWYWELVTFARKAFVCAAVNLPVGNSGRILILVLGSVLFTASFSASKPHSVPWVNAVDWFFHCMFVLTVMAGTCFYTEKLASADQKAGRILLVMMLYTFVLVGVSGTLYQVLPQLRASILVVRMRWRDWQLWRKRVNGEVTSVDGSDNWLRAKQAILERLRSRGGLQTLRQSERFLKDVSPIREKLTRTSQAQAYNEESSIAAAVARLRRAHMCKYAHPSCAGQVTQEEIIPRKDLALQIAMWTCFEANAHNARAWIWFHSFARTWQMYRLRLDGIMQIADDDAEADKGDTNE